MMNNLKIKPEQATATLRIPDQYREDDSIENQAIYGLSQIGEGSAADIGVKISELDKSVDPAGFSNIAEPMLRKLWEQGLINCRMGNDNLGYYSIPGNNR